MVQALERLEEHVSTVLDRADRSYVSDRVSLNELMDELDESLRSAHDVAAVLDVAIPDVVGDGVLRLSVAESA